MSGCGAVKSWAQECGSVRGPVLCCVPDGLSGRDSALREAGRPPVASCIGRRVSGRSVFLGKETSGLRQSPPCLLETWVSGARPRLCPLVPVEEINRCLGQGCWPRPRWGLAPRTLSASPWSRSPRVPAALLLPAGGDPAAGDRGRRGQRVWALPPQCPGPSAVLLPASTHPVLWPPSVLAMGPESVGTVPGSQGGVWERPCPHLVHASGAPLRPFDLSHVAGSWAW